MHILTDRATAMAARARLLAIDLEDGAGDRSVKWRDETGAQAAEYAMLGGVSAAACSGLVMLLRNPDTLSTIVDAVVGSIGGVVGSWF